ncbi:MAG: preQ(1) synthase [Verrucomicrobiota bacterium]
MSQTRKKKNDPHKNLSLLKAGEKNYPDSPDAARLEAFENTHPDRDYWITFDCPEFTAMCPITGQPDFGKILIEYIPARRCIESKSLKLYLFAFRNEGAFHEEVVNRILDDVVKTCRPRKAIVTGIFNPRGGIGLTVKAEYRGRGKT